MNGRLRWTIALTALVALVVSNSELVAQTGSRRSNEHDDLLALVQHLVEEIQQLRAKLEELEAKVVQLEAQAKPPTDASPLGAEEPDVEDPAALPARLMQVERWRELPPDPAITRQAEDLRKQAQLKDNEVSSLHAEKNKLMKCSYCARLGYHCSNKDLHDKSELERARQRQNLSTRISKIESDAKNLRSRADRLDRENAAKRQEITGWDGAKTVVLRTVGDQSGVLSKLTDGGFVTWRGTVVSHNADDNVQVWKATSIAVADSPPGFASRSS